MTPCDLSQVMFVCWWRFIFIPSSVTPATNQLKVTQRQMTLISKHYPFMCQVVQLLHSCFLMFSGSSSLDTGLYFADQPQDVIVIKNTALVLNCSAQDSDGAVNITWRKDGELVNDQRRVLLRNGSLYFKRVVRHKQFTDEGLYQCVLRNHIGTIVSRKLQLQVASKSRQ